ncbi:MAG: nitrilase [Mesorhizobium amorphae]|nr:MAG: nitrilase [Mesorhizobium amorphae]
MAFTAALLQMRSGTEPGRNIEAMRTLAHEAAAAGATYLQTPEMTGALVRDRAALRAMLKSDDEDGVVAAARDLATELGVWFHLGSTAIARPDGKVANRGFVFAPDGSRTAVYDKIHMFDVDLDSGESWRESATYEAGTHGLVAPVAGARMGFAICYDLRFPQLFRAEALAGAQVLTAPAAFTRQTGEAHWHVLLRARAVENGAWALAAAQGGRHEDGRETYGHSLVVDPWGRVVAEAPGDEPCVVLAEIEPEQSAAARAKIPNLRNAREFGMEGA